MLAMSIHGSPTFARHMHRGADHATITLRGRNPVDRTPCSWSSATAERTPPTWPSPRAAATASGRTGSCRHRGPRNLLGQPRPAARPGRPGWRGTAAAAVAGGVRPRVPGPPPGAVAAGPGLTELYFLDEATALAAGHRPCGECRHAAYRAFADAWAVAHPTDEAGARHLDARLHRDRIDPNGPDGPSTGRTAPVSPTSRTGPSSGWRVPTPGWSSAPSCSPGRPPGTPRHRPRTAIAGTVTVLTPRSTTVAALAAGYRPLVHPSAGPTSTDH